MVSLASPIPSWLMPFMQRQPAQQPQTQEPNPFEVLPRDTTVEDETDPLNDFWSSSRATQPAPPAIGQQPGPDNGPDTGPEPTNPANQVPSGGQSGGWAGFLQDPSNRAFMLNMGLQLMSGGWGNFSQQLAQGLAAGFQGGRAEETGLPLEPAASARPGRRPAQTPGRRVGADTQPLVRAPISPQMQAASEFIQSNPTPEQWEEQNQPNGIVYAAFGGPKPYEQRNDLLHLVQNPPTDQRAPSVMPAGRDLRELSWEDLIVLGSSRNPADRAAFQQEASRRNGRGYEYFIGPSGNVERRRTPLAARSDQDPRNPISTPQMERQIQQLRRAFGVLVGSTDEQGLLTGRGGSSMVGRGIAQLPGGTWANPETAEAFAAAQHAIMQLTYGLSGRAIGQSEQRRLIEIFTPHWNDTQEMIAFRLNEAYVLYQSMLRARTSGAPERQLGELFQSELARADQRLQEQDLLVRQGRGGPIRGPANIQLNEPAVPGQTPPAAAPPAPTPAPTGAPGSTRDNPLDVTSPEGAARVPSGQWFRTPDGRVLQRQ